MWSICHSLIRYQHYCGRWPVNSPHKGPVTRDMFPFDYVKMKMFVFLLPASPYLRRVKYVCVISNAQNTWMNNNFSGVGLEPKFCQHCACRWPSTATVLNNNTECFPTSYPGYFVTLLLTGRRHSMMTSSSGNIFCVTGPLWGIHRLQQMFEQKSRRRWFETPSYSLWRHCNTKWATRSRDRSRHL